MLSSFDSAVGGWLRIRDGVQEELTGLRGPPQPPTCLRDERSRAEATCQSA